MTNNLIITLNNADIKNDHTDSGRLIDKIAVALDQWTENEAWENNTEYERESFDYIMEHWREENDLIAALDQAEKKNKAAGLLNALTEIHDETPEEIAKLITARKARPKLKAGAAIALQSPESWTALLESYKEKAEEYMHEYFDNPWLNTYAPDLQKELQESIDSFWKQLEHDRIWGDRDSAGIIRTLEKKMEAEDVNYNEKSEIVTLEFTPDQAAEFYENNTGEETKKITAGKLKRAVVDWITSNQEHEHNKKKAENEKRRAESERVNTYKAEQKKIAEAERIAKLAAMKK